MADVQIDQQNAQIILAVPGVQGPKGEGFPTGGTANQVLFKQSSTNYDIAWGAITSAMIDDLQIVNGDISTTAAIDGTKISPNFGAQNVVTTGTSTAASFIPTSSTVPTNGFYLPAANSVAISTDATERVEFGTSEVVFNHGGANYDFRIEGDTNSSLFFVDASTDRVGIGTASPAVAFDVVGQLRASAGILFGSDTAAANALDDYEEGTYSMSVTGTSGGSIVFTNPTLTYLKVGRLVFISGSIVVSSSTAAGSELIASLPFSVPSTSSFGEKDCTFKDNSAGTRTVIYLRADSTSLFKLSLNAATPAVNDVFTFSFSYYAA